MNKDLVRKKDEIQYKNIIKQFYYLPYLRQF